MESKYPGWLFDVSDFSALPGKGVQCTIEGKPILVSPHSISLSFNQADVAFKCTATSIIISHFIAAYA